MNIVCLFLFFIMSYKNYKSVCFDKVDHVIFDLDGTLIDSELLYIRINNEILQMYGLEFPKCSHINILGVNEIDVAKYIIKTFNLNISLEEYMNIIHAKQKEIFPNNTKLQPGAEKLILHLANHDIPMAIGTSSTQAACTLKLTNFQDLFKHIHHIVTFSDIAIKNSKPAPDIYLEAAKRFDLRPNVKRCLVFEDSPVGVKAAKKAGMQVIWVSNLENKPINLLEPTLTIRSLLKFRPEMFGLPPYP